MTDLELRKIIAERIADVQSRIDAACRRAGRDPGDVTLVAVTKSVSSRVAGLLPALGVFDLGESRPQELWKKAEELKHLPIRWHLIGHLQRNKVERTLPLVHLIHSVDSPRLLQAIAVESAKRERRSRILLQMNVSHEEQKHGFDFAELPKAADIPPSVEVIGLMGMAAVADDPERARPAFAMLRQFRDRLRLAQLSMGMSGDFEVAVEEGSTLVRIGTNLFAGLGAE